MRHLKRFIRKHFYPHDFALVPLLIITCFVGWTAANQLPPAYAQSQGPYASVESRQDVERMLAADPGGSARWLGRNLSPPKLVKFERKAAKAAKQRVHKVMGRSLDPSNPAMIEMQNQINALSEGEGEGEPEGIAEGQAKVESHETYPGTDTMVFVDASVPDPPQSTLIEHAGYTDFVWVGGLDTALPTDAVPFEYPQLHLSNSYFPGSGILTTTSDIKETCAEIQRLLTETKGKI